MGGQKFPLDDLRVRLQRLGASEVLVKNLAPNDNSKNQIYLAGDISGLGLLPTGEVTFNQGTSKKPGAKRGPIFRAAMDLWWLTNDGSLSRAPNTKLILYPQYSEVRMSGFVTGTRNVPSELFDVAKRGREPGRVLVLAPLADRRVIACIFPGDSGQAEILRRSKGEPYGVMQRFDLQQSSPISSEILLLTELRRIHKKGWLDPVYLEADGTFRPCVGSNCGGVTLESHLGIRPNGFAEPDFHGWEIKQHSVGSWDKPSAGRITLMTPEPSGGAYVEEGPKYFVETWGYPDQMGRNDRLNFGGVYRVGGQANERTGLRLILAGFDEPTARFSGDGAVLLVDAKDRVAASWSFSKLIDHWKRKHAKAAFVPSVCIKEPKVQYQYGSHIALAEGAKFSLLLQAFAYGSVFYDPGIKLEGREAGTPKLKRRSQFRIDSRRLKFLYGAYREVDLANEES